MRHDQFTTKSQEAFAAALKIAASRKHAEAAPEHLLLALLEQADGIVVPVLRKLGAGVEPLRAEVNAALEALPTLATADEPATSRELMTVLRAADAEAGKLRDEYISTEHLLLALADGKGAVADALRRNGVTRDGALKAIEEVRGPHRVTDQEPEEKYQSLQKFGRDLTEAARDGKLDPVIGRDDEIRR